MLENSRSQSIMRAMSAYRSPAWRAARLLARALGTLLGPAAVLLLRLTARKAGVALVYHRVGPRPGDRARELVPFHEGQLFEGQVRHLVRYYDVVPATRLLEAARARRRGQRFPVAITFDDDLACHATVALPILRGLGAAATFFLCGASLDRPFAFPFERLQRAADEGVPELAAIVTGRPGATEPSRIHELGLTIELMSPDERDAAAARLAAALGPDPPDAGIRAERVRELAEAGMSIGFHTLRHDSLIGLTDDRLAEAMQAGLGQLARAAGSPVDTIGYPHGRADVRVAAAARAAGFRAGFTTRGRPVTPEADPLLQGRISPSLHSVGSLALYLPLTLLRSVGS